MIISTSNNCYTIANYLKEKDLTTINNLSTLVLNQNYEPLHVCAVRRAIVLTITGRADLLEQGDEGIRSAGGKLFSTPSVIRLQSYIKRPIPRPRLTRKEIFSRDGYRCQYCAIKLDSQHLTLDHVVPRRLGGQHEWENITTACSKCNHKKGGRTPLQAGMRLNADPVRPRIDIGRTFISYVAQYSEWEQYLLPWYRKSAA